MIRSRLSVLLAVAVFVACDGAPTAPRVSPHLGLVISVSKPAFSFAADTTVRVTLHNTSDRPIHLSMSTYVFCERLRDGTWQYERAWFVLDGDGVSFPLGPGASIAADMPLGMLAGPGTFRFQYVAYADSARRTALQVTDRVSAAFTVTP